MRLRVTVAPTGRHPVLQAAGEVDVSDVARLGAAIRDAFAENHTVVVDLSEVTFIDSTGALALLREQQAADARGHYLALVAPHERVTRVFTLLGIDETLHIHPSLDQVPPGP